MESFLCTIAICLVAVRASIPLEEFYPYNLSVNQQLIANDDASSRAITLDPPLTFYGRSYNSCKIHNNGLVTFNTPPQHFLKDPFPLADYTFIAPFYGDVDTRKTGTVWFTDPVVNESSVLDKVENDIHDTFKDHASFKPAYVIIATWDQVGYFKERSDKLNTFQCIITSDGCASFVIFLYNEIQWTTDESNSTSKHAKIGFNDGTLIMSWEVPCSMTMNLKEISRTSNVGIAGKWIFRVDTTNFSTCHNDYAMACESDPFCSCSTPDPQQKCMCTNLKEDMPVTTPTTEGFNGNSYPLASDEIVISAAAFFSWLMVITELHTA